MSPSSGTSAGLAPYEILDAEIGGVRATQRGFTQLVGTSPFELPGKVVDAAEHRYSTINRFFDASIEIFAEALAGELPDEVLALLLNETPQSYGAEFHRAVLARRRSRPQFFRTDEVRPGRIVEIQCPGSLWGEYEALVQIAARNGRPVQSLARKFSDQVAELTGSAPTVHHLLDNASSPHTMRYFIECTRPEVRYFGIDAGVTQNDCQFVRSHSFFGQAGENFFTPRLERYLDGDLLFDLPPNVIFDQKITLALPFMELTRDRFSDDVREMLVFSSVVTPNGFATPDGGHVSLEDFASSGRAARRWFLKYAGSDVSINWGSRAVYRLDNIGREACLDRLKRAAAGHDSGRIWIVQPQEQESCEVEFFSRSGEIERADLTAKYSTFYGPSGYLGTLVQHRDFYKVHGQDDTVVSLGFADDSGRPTTA